MAKEAREYLVEGLNLSVYPWDGSDYGSDAIQLCGADSLSFTDGGAEEKDVTDFCDAKSRQRRKIAGLKDPGSLNINFVRFDPKQDGQKWLLDAEPNTRFKLVVQGEVQSVTETTTFFLKKKTSPSFEYKMGEQRSGSVECISDAPPAFE